MGYNCLGYIVICMILIFHVVTPLSPTASSEGASLGAENY